MSTLSLHNHTIKVKYAFYILLIIFIGIYLYHIDLSLVVSYLLKSGWKFLLILPISGAGYLLATLAWQFCMSKDVLKVSLARLFIIRHIGETLAIVNPATIIAGDGAKTVLLKKQDIRASDAMPSIILSRALIILSSFVLLLVGASLLVPVIQGKNLMGITLISLFLTGIILIIIWRGLISKQLFVYAIIKFLLKKWMDSPKVKSFLITIKRVNIEMAIYHRRHKFKLYIAFILSLLHWLVGVAEFFFILKILGVSIDWAGAFILEMGVAAIKNMGAFIPGQLGIEEAGNKLMLDLIGVSIPMMWLAVSALRRCRQLFWIAVGILMFYINNKSYQ